VSLKTFLSKVRGEPTLERAEKAYAGGRKVDAAQMFRVLAEGGSEAAQVRLAKLYETGEGVLQNFVEAARWYRKAAEKGSETSQARLGEMYLTGMSPAKTATAAALARIEGGSDQESLIKRLYPQGLSLPQDSKEAAHWNTLAAEGAMPAPRRASVTNTRPAWAWS